MRFRITYIALIVCTFASCKKDVLHFKGIQILNSNTTSRLNRIQFVDNNTCIIGGGERYLKAEVIMSTDGGFTFSDNSFLDAGKGLYGLGVSPSGHIYLSGFDGKCLYSADKGHNWQVMQVSSWAYYVGISFPVDTIGYLVSTVGQDSGTVDKVDNSLQIFSSKKYRAGLNNIKMADANTGYIIGYGCILKTTDAGNNWSFADIVANDNYTGIDIHNSNDVWVCGYGGSVFHTIDGTSWNCIRDGNALFTNKYHLCDIVFQKDNMHGWAVGEGGLIITTDDGGTHWEEYDHFTDNALRSIAFCPNGDLLIAGDNGTLVRIKP